MTGEPRIVRVLPGRVEQREPWPAEIDFFRAHPNVAGMATEDGRVVLSPFSQLTDSQQAAVALNEAARVFMERESLIPCFDLTPAQAIAFANYGPIEAQRATIAARLLSGDPSATSPTEQQIAFVRTLAKAMKVHPTRCADEENRADFDQRR